MSATEEVARRGKVRHERVLREQRRADRPWLLLRGEAQPIDGVGFRDTDAAHAGPSAGRDRLTMGPDDRFDVVEQFPSEPGRVSGGRGPDGRRRGAVLNSDDDVLIRPSVALDGKA